MLLGSAKRRFTMFTLSRVARCAALGAFVALGGFDSPARADDPIQHLGPVGPHEAITTTFGSKGVIAFYEPDGVHCGLYAVVYSRGDESGALGVQVRLSLNAQQVISIDSADHKSLSLQCGDNAATLRIVNPKTWIGAGAAQ
jgi:hypothetical protein